MSEEDIENARRSYAAINQAYRSGDPTEYLPILEELFHPDAVLEPAGILPESGASCPSRPRCRAGTGSWGSWPSR